VERQGEGQREVGKRRARRRRARGMAQSGAGTAGARHIAGKAGGRARAETEEERYRR
jgi:hypothetical protein